MAKCQNRLATGSLVKHPEFYKPSLEGTLAYFDSPSGNLENDLNEVDAAGGKVVICKKQISPDHGYMAVFYDTEGSRVALHSLGEGCFSLSC